MQYVLIDLSGLWWSVWYATEAVQECTRRVLATIQRYSVNARGNLAVAVDRGSHRYAVMSERGMAYKGDRPEKDRRAVEGLRRIEGRLRDLGWCVFAAEGYEADDVLASLTSRLYAHGFASGMEPDVEGYGTATHDITVVSADKDLRQLVGMATVESPLTGEVFAEREDVVKKHGVKPEQLSDWLALVGDKSDSIPGIDRVGPKTAAALLESWGDLTGIALALSTGEDLGLRITSTALQNLSDGIEQAQWIAQSITPLVDDLELDEALLERLITGAPAPLPKEEDMGDIDDHDSPYAEADLPRDATPPPASESQPQALATIDAELVETTSSANGLVSNAQLNTMYRMSKALVRSRSIGSAYGTPEDVMAVVMAGQELGMRPMEALRSFHVIEGRPQLSAQTLLAMCRAHPNCKVFRVDIKQCTRERGVCLVQHATWPEPEEWDYTIDEAQDANLTGKGVWKKHARDMLINRCISRVAHFVFPEVGRGIYTPEDFGGYSGAAS